LKTRIISGVIGVIVMLIIVYSGSVFVAISIFLLALMGVHEFYNAVANVGYKPVRFVGFLSCIPILIIGLDTKNRIFMDYVEAIKSVSSISLGLFLVIVALFLMIIFKHEKFSIINISLTVFGMLYIPFLFAFVVLTRKMDNGLLFLWFILIGAFGTDTFAYFGGRFLGKNKILPVISPKKTWEGAISGVVGSVMISLAYGLLFNQLVEKSDIIAPYHFIVIGMLTGIISQIGDWGASAIKRFSKIKDYGQLMPGHGGVLDRFDSILLVAPTVYFYVSTVIIGIPV